MSRMPAVAIAALALACGGGGGRPPGPVPVEVVPVASRPNGRLCEPARVVVRTQARWQALWTQIAGEVPPPPAPEVDFGRQMLLVVASGVRGGGGHAIGVEGAAVQDGKIIASVVETSPGPRCVTTQALTCPVAVARLEARDGAVEFRTRSVVRDCGR